MIDRCPKCHADLNGAEIPAAIQRWYDGRTHFTRRIAIVRVGQDDRLLWQCPDCGYRWIRFEPAYSDHRRALWLDVVARTGG